MKFYVIATDRSGYGMSREGLMIEKKIIVCDDVRQARRVSEKLKGIKKFKGIQMTSTPPELNTKIYNPVFSEGRDWLR